MLDRGAKKILAIKFRMPSQSMAGKSTTNAGRVMGQKQLNALFRSAVPPGEVLNPYGKYGNTRRSRYRITYFGLKLKTSFREAGMKRKRIKMLTKKAIALEAHELQQLARENATVAMSTLIEISKNKRAPEATRIAASAVILDRAYGKASQTSITANIGNGKTSDIDSGELDNRISRALKRVEDLTNRAPKAGASQKGPVNLRQHNQHPERSPKGGKLH